MSFLLAPEAISGKEGIITAVINGQVVTLGEIRTLTAHIDKRKAEIRTMGVRGTQHKATGWSGTGSVTFYYVTSRWTELMTQYINTGKDVYFDINIVNEDPGSNTGRQQIKLSQCNLDGLDIAKYDVDAEFLDAPLNFTFSDVELVGKFNNIF